MADEADVRGANGGNADDIRVVMNLPRLGELIAAVATKFAVLRGIDPPDFEGQEGRDLALYGWRHVVFMADREEFKESIATDLEMLDLLGTQTRDSQSSEPEHKPEFGL